MLSFLQVTWEKQLSIVLLTILIDFIANKIIVNLFSQAEN